MNAPLAHLRILMVEDSPVDAELLERELRRGGLSFSLQRVQSERELRQALEQSDPDIILADYHLPGFDGITALKIVRATHPDLPFIFVSGSIGEERATQALREGATDYLFKDRMSRLPSAITRAVDERRGRGQRQRVQEALRLSEERLRYATEATQELILDWFIPNDRITYNQAMATVWGHHPPGDEVDMKWFLDQVHPEDAEHVRRAKLQAVEMNDHPVEFTYRFRRGDGSYGYVLDRGLIVRDKGQPVRLICALLDVSDQRAAEDRVRASELRFRSVAESASDGIIVCDASGKVIFWNAAAERMFGYGGAEALGQPITTFMTERFAMRHAAVIEEYLRVQNPNIVAGTVEFTATRKDGTEFPAEHSISPWNVEDQLFFTVVVRDITERAERLLNTRLQDVISTALLGVGDVTEAISSTLSAVGRELECEVAEYWDVNAEHLRLQRGAMWSADVRGTYGEFPPARISDVMDFNEFLEGRVWSTGRSAIAARVQEQDGSASTESRLSTPYAAAFPVVEEGAVTGIFTLGRRQPFRHQEQLLRALDEAGVRVGEVFRRRRAEQRLAESEAQLAEAQQLAQLGSWSYDVIEQRGEWSAEASRIFGLSAESRVITLHQYVQSVHPDDRADVLRLLAPPFREPRFEFHHRLVRSDGVTRVAHCHVNVAAGTPASPLRLSGTIQDITTQITAEETIRRLSRQNELILSSAGEPIIGINTNGRAMFANPAAARTLGWSTDAILSAANVDLLLQSSSDGDFHDAESCPIETTLRDGTSHEGEAVFWSKGGERLEVEYQCSGIVEDSTLMGAVLTFRDVGARKRLERQLEQSERLSGLGRLAASVAHEFNNVLMGIQPFAEVLRRRVTDEKAQRATAQILSSVARGKSVTEGILRFAQPSTPVLRAVDLREWLHRLLPELQALAGTKVHVELDVPPHAVSAFCDDSQMQQVITNLVLNARDAMSGGVITIVLADPQESALLDGVPPGMVTLAVRDTGHGMPPSILQHVFEPLFTTKRSGTGLGLAVAHQVVTRNEGIMSVTSEVDVGTTFFIALKAAEPGERAARIPEAAAPEGPPVRSLLLVEDEEAVVAGLRDLLESSGVDVRVSRTGAEAIDALEEFEPDAVLLDLSLPDMSGTTVYERMAERHPDLCVVFSTGQGDAAALDPYLGHHVGFLRKPYDERSLFDKLAEVCAGTVQELK